MAAINLDYLELDEKFYTKEGYVNFDLAIGATYNRYDCFLIHTPRGDGKSSWWMNKCIEDYKDHKAQFCWVVHDEKVMYSVSSRLIPDWIKKKHGIASYKIDKGEVKVKWVGEDYSKKTKYEPAPEGDRIGFFIALSTFKRGQRDFKDIDKLIYDEYNLKPSDESDLFAFGDIVSTIFDKRDGYKIVMLGNQDIFYNIFLITFNKPTTLLIESHHETQPKDTPLRRLFEGTTVGDYMFSSNYFKNYQWFEPNFDKQPKKLVLISPSLEVWYSVNTKHLVMRPRGITSQQEIKKQKGYTEIINAQDLGDIMIPYLKANKGRFYLVNEQEFKMLSGKFFEFLNM